MTRWWRLLRDVAAYGGQLGAEAWEAVHLKHQLADLAADYDILADQHRRTLAELAQAEQAFAELSHGFAQAVGVAFRAGAEAMANDVKAGNDPDEVLARAEFEDQLRANWSAN